LDRAARAVGSDVAARHADDVDRQARFPKEALDALKAAKLLGILVPKDKGGPGAGIADVVSVCHVLGSTAPRPRWSTPCTRSRCRASCGTVAQCWLDAFMKRLLATTAARVGTSKQASVATYVRAFAPLREGRPFALAKQATVISYGANSDGVLVTARRTLQSPASDQVIVVVPKSSATLEQLQDWDTLGMRGTCSIATISRPRRDGADHPEALCRLSAQTMLPTSHLVWSALWLGIATDAVRACALLSYGPRRARSRAPCRRVRCGLPRRPASYSS